jgi:hypothetical protein
MLSDKEKGGEDSSNKGGLLRSTVISGHSGASARAQFFFPGLAMTSSQMPTMSSTLGRHCASSEAA